MREAGLSLQRLVKKLGGRLCGMQRSVEVCAQLGGCKELLRPSVIIARMVPRHVTLRMAVRRIKLPNSISVVSFVLCLHALFMPLFNICCS